MRFETSVRIARPIEEVFAYVSDPGHFPAWNSAVEAVQRPSVGEGGVGSTYAMQRKLPSGSAENEFEIVVFEQPREFAIRTTSGPTPFDYRYRFSPEDGATVVHLSAEVELGGVAALAGPLGRRFVTRGVDENLAALKYILEERQVSD
jgi:uncharacterized protein YndB with AHSA1/START domain